VVEGNVEVHTHEGALAGECDVVEGFFGHGRR
jgi:hypothetical protein